MSSRPGRAALRLAALVTLAGVGPGWAGDFSYAQWREMPETWQRGYAAAVIGRLSIVENSYDPNGHARSVGFSKCLSGMTDTDGLAIIRQYAINHPEAFILTASGIAVRAFNEQFNYILPPSP